MAVSNHFGARKNLKTKKKKKSLRPPLLTHCAAVAEKAVPLPVAKVAKPIVPKQGASEDEDLDFLDSLPDPAKAAATPENKLGKLAENAAADEEWLDDFLGE